MSIHSHTLANQKSTSTVRARSGSTILVPFSNRGHRVAKIQATPFASEWPSAKAAMRRPVPATTGGSATDRSRPSGVVIDFVHAPRSGHAARIREESSNKTQTSLTLADLAVIICALMATAFYPALAWFLIGS
jgi:hypothetical protein